MENDEEVRFQRAGNPHILCSINHVLLIFLQQNLQCCVPAPGSTGLWLGGRWSPRDSPRPWGPSAAPPDGTRGHPPEACAPLPLLGATTAGWDYVLAFALSEALSFPGCKRVEKGIVLIMVIKLPGNSLIRLIKSK